jgi:hypothetical protein
VSDSEQAMAKEEDAPIIRLDKLEAARRQLETAIKLYFDYGDEASIQTLASAGYALLRDINEHRGGEPMLKDLHRLLDGELAKEFRKWINRPENFLKHADMDPDESYEWDFRWTQVLMWEASQKYLQLATLRPAMVVFMFWFVAKRPDFSPGILDELADKSPPKLFQSFLESLKAFPNDRREYFRMYLPILFDALRD